jgi:hypothetical protein
VTPAPAAADPGRLRTRGHRQQALERGDIAALVVVFDSRPGWQIALRIGAEFRKRGIETIEVVVQLGRPAAIPRFWVCGLGICERDRRLCPLDEALPVSCPTLRGCALDQILDARDHLLRFERLHEHAVAVHLPGACLVDRLERTGEEQHRNVGEVGPPLDEGRDVVAAALGHADVGQHDVWQFDGNPRDRLLAVSDSYHLHVLAGERQLDDTLNRHAVVGEQELVRHKSSQIPTRVRAWRVMKSTMSCIGVPG